MMHSIRKQGKDPIYVNVFGAKASALRQHQEVLTETGYCLDFPSKSLTLSIEEKLADIYIIDFIEIEQNQDVFQSRNLPYLVYGLDGLPEKNSKLELLHNAVGYFTDIPTVNAIRLNIQLGMYSYRERENYNHRMQNVSDKIENNRLTGIATGLLIGKTGLSPEEVFEMLKLISRNKQRRVVDVAKEAIDILTAMPHNGKGSISDNAIENLAQWLDDMISYRSHHKKG